MVVTLDKIKVLKAVAVGNTLSAAGLTIGVSPSRASQIVARLCRELKLSSSLSEIRSNSKVYLKALKELEESPIIDLRNPLIRKLKSILLLKNIDELTPKYLSNITASQLMDNGITAVAINEIQNWLSTSNLSLKKSLPKNEQEIKKVRQAISLLDSFQFDTSLVKKQLSNLIK